MCSCPKVECIERHPKGYGVSGSPVSNVPGFLDLSCLKDDIITRITLGSPCSEHLTGYLDKTLSGFALWRPALVDPGL